jgi:hypothetical protein
MLNPNAATLVSALAVGGVIAIHEAGHFYAAKLQGYIAYQLNLQIAHILTLRSIRSALLLNKQIITLRLLSY